MGQVSFFPKSLQFSNFKEAFTRRMIFIESLDREIPGFLVFMPTILVAAMTTLERWLRQYLLISFSRLKFFGRDTLFSLLLATMMVPGEIFIITNFATISNWDLTNTYWALVLPLDTSVLYLLLRQTFMQIPNELYLSAKVDGTRILNICLK